MGSQTNLDLLSSHTVGAVGGLVQLLGQVGADLQLLRLFPRKVLVAKVTVARSLLVDRALQAELPGNGRNF